MLRLPCPSVVVSPTVLSKRIARQLVAEAAVETATEQMLRIDAETVLKRMKKRMAAEAAAATAAAAAAEDAKESGDEEEDPIFRMTYVHNVEGGGDLKRRTLPRADEWPSDGGSNDEGSGDEGSDDGGSGDSGPVHIKWSSDSGSDGGSESIPQPSDGKVEDDSGSNDEGSNDEGSNDGDWDQDWDLDWDDDQPRFPWTPERHAQYLSVLDYIAKQSRRECTTGSGHSDLHTNSEPARLVYNEVENEWLLVNPITGANQKLQYNLVLLERAVHAQNHRVHFIAGSAKKDAMVVFGELVRDPRGRIYARAHLRTCTINWTFYSPKDVSEHIFSVETMPDHDRVYQIANSTVMVLALDARRQGYPGAWVDYFVSGPDDGVAQTALVVPNAHANVEALERRKDRLESVESCYQLPDWLLAEDNLFGDDFAVRFDIKYFGTVDMTRYFEVADGDGTARRRLENRETIAVCVDDCRGKVVALTQLPTSFMLFALEVDGVRVPIHNPIHVLQQPFVVNRELKLHFMLNEPTHVRRASMKTCRRNETLQLAMLADAQDNLLCGDDVFCAWVGESTQLFTRCSESGCTTQLVEGLPWGVFGITRALVQRGICEGWSKKLSQVAFPLQLVELTPDATVADLQDAQVTCVRLFGTSNGVSAWAKLKA